MEGRDRQGSRAQQGQAARGDHLQRRHVRLRPMDGVRGLCRRQTLQGRLPFEQHRSERPPLYGLRGRRLHPCIRRRRAHGLLRRPRARRRLCAVGLEYGRDAPGAMVAPDRYAADQTRLRSACPVDLRAPQLRARRPWRDLQATDRSGDPQLYRQLHRAERRGQLGLRQRPRELHQDADRHRLWSAPRRSARKGGQERRQGQAKPDRLRPVQERPRTLHRRVCLRAVGRAGREPGTAGQAVCRPEA